jgi:predicted tellurium resistance membrane protein TerC
MENLAGNLVSLGLLILLQAVLGFDNLLYITLESRRAPAEKQALVRRLGIGIAVLLRIGLLFLLMELIKFFQDPIISLHIAGAVNAAFNLHSIIVLAGGVFIIYTAVREIMHMMSLEVHDHAHRAPQSVGRIVTLIVSMNLVFSFDSILSAMALSDVFWVMATAIIVGGALMIWLSDSVSAFLEKNRLYEVLGLFILFVVGIMLLTEGGHLGHLELAGRPITPMSKTTFYFVIAVLVLTDVVQSRYQRRLMRLREAGLKS